MLGPTNTGKTHYAVERMLSYPTGIIGLPLRLLAREIYDRICALRGPDEVALVTGEEKIQPGRARYFVCTTEAMPLSRQVDFVAIDEIQLCADPERGHIFTDRLLHARGRHETLFLGSENIRSRIASLVPRVRFERRERFSTLTYTGPNRITRLKPRTAVVAFSADRVYAIAELIRRQRGGAAVVLGALSPRTRNAQVALYQNGDVDYIVATDAIGMGLNMDIDHVAFAGLTKFDGRRHRRLEPNELAQIAGRAGRYTRDGTFGITGEAAPLDPATIEAIEAHRFKPLARLMWRNRDLDFSSVPGLVASLEAGAPVPDLVRAREADDVAVLKRLWLDPEIRSLADHPSRVRLLWEVCQTPDYRKTMGADHAALLGRIFRFLIGPSGVIPTDWIAAQVRRIDRIGGDIDALSTRLAHVRTWTFVANRGRWLEDPETWRGITREVEDRLSEALHQRLTQRFVDRRTSVLMRRLKQKEELVAEVNHKGEVSVEGHYVGRLEGFRFTVDERADGEEGRLLRSAGTEALRAELARRADRLYAAPDGEIELTEQGGLMWGTEAVGRLERGDHPRAPRIRVFVDDVAGAEVATKVERRLSHWLRRRIETLFEPLLALERDEAITGLARGVAFQLVEAMGILPRRRIAAEVKELDQQARGLLRRHGVRFGQYHVYLPALLKPAPTHLRLILWCLWEGFEVFPEAPPPGLVTIPAIEGAPRGYYEKVGYRLAGERAIRIDMLERLADLLRSCDSRQGFEATPDMLSITGLTLEQFADLMQGLGYRAERGERARRARAAPVTAPDPGVLGAGPGNGDSEGDAPEPREAAESETTPPADIQAALPPARVGSDEPRQEMAATGSTTPGNEGSGEREEEREFFYVFRLARRPARRREKQESKAPGRSGEDRAPRVPRAKRAGPSKERSRPADKTIDPDSPFAILARLKEGNPPAK